MTLFQILAALFGLSMLYVITIHRRKARLSLTETSFWYSIWCLFVVIALFPNLLIGISTTLKFSRVFDLLVVLSFMVITVVSIVNYLLLRETKSSVESSVRKEAIANAKKNRTP